jgi:hypothetical protein
MMELALMRLCFQQCEPGADAVSFEFRTPAVRQPGLTPSTDLHPPGNEPLTTVHIQASLGIGPLSSPTLHLLVVAIRDSAYAAPMKVEASPRPTLARHMPPIDCPDCSNRAYLMRRSPLQRSGFEERAYECWSCSVITMQVEQV